jgi:platelet-activating factor acetylhydrolase
MLTLPEVSGKYPVGATTFAIPITTKDEASRTIGRAKLRPSSGGQPDAPALKLEEVAFTAYYPADTSSGRKLQKGVHWVQR